eukprot:2281933-Rhodomonas_salina.1
MVERVLRCMLLLCFVHAGTTFSVTPFVRFRPSPPARQFRLWPQPQKLASTRSVPGLPPPTVLAGSVDSDVEPICSEEIFTLEANFSLAARVWRHPGPATSTRPEDNWLALHGYADSAASYDLLAPLLIKDGAACVVHASSQTQHAARTARALSSPCLTLAMAAGRLGLCGARLVRRKAQPLLPRCRYDARRGMRPLRARARLAAGWLRCEGGG